MSKDVKEPRTYHRMPTLMEMLRELVRLRGLRDCERDLSIFPYWLGQVAIGRKAFPKKYKKQFISYVIRNYRDSPIFAHWPYDYKRKKEKPKAADPNKFKSLREILKEKNEQQQATDF